MKAVFRVDASSTMGMGHLMRCLALAQSFEQASLELLFIVNEEAIDICKARHDWAGKIEVCPKKHLTDADWLLKKCDSIDASVVVVDGYHFSEEFRKKLRSFTGKIVAFDDTNDLRKVYADVVINGAQNAEDFHYEESAPGAIHCLGDKYRILRKEFSLLPVIPVPLRHSLLISMGGSDPKGLTLPLLQALEDSQFNSLVRVVTGAAIADLNAIESFVAKSPMAIQHIHNSQDMADLYCHAGLAISAAGGSQFELCACGTPSILLVVADNQVNATEQAAKQGWCETFDAREHIDFTALVNVINALWLNVSLREQMSDTAYQYADVAGADRVTEALRKLVMEDG